MPAPGHTISQGQELRSSDEGRAVAAQMEEDHLKMLQRHTREALLICSIWLLSFRCDWKLLVEMDFKLSQVFAKQ